MWNVRRQSGEIFDLRRTYVTCCRVLVACVVLTCEVCFFSTTRLFFVGSRCMGAAVARVCCEARAVELLRNTKRDCERGFDGVQRNVPTIVHDRTVQVPVVVLLSRSEEQRCHQV